MNWCDEEFVQRMVALDEVLDRHLGSPPDIIDPLDAEYVMMPLWLPSAGLGAMNPRREREKLARTHKLAQELSEVWKSLHADVRSQMELESYARNNIRGPAGFYKSTYPLSLQIISVLDLVVEATKPIATQIIDDAPSAGRRDLTNVGIVEHLRIVWEQRKNEPAPKSMTEAGQFANYIFDAFQALNLRGHPRAAMDSWREFRAKHPATT
jgi:hypothetical protein